MAQHAIQDISNGVDMRRELTPTEYTRINEILVECRIACNLHSIIQTWDSPWRHYHTSKNHLIPILIELFNFQHAKHIAEDEFKSLIIAALFHDIVYLPSHMHNEKDSVEVLCYFAMDDKEPHIINAIRLIESTIDHDPKSDDELIMFDLDFVIFREDLMSLIRYEKLIQKEYQFLNWSDYKEKRIKFLGDIYYGKACKRLALSKEQKQNIWQLIEYIKNYEPRIAVYAGSFNPFHIGHLNIVEKLEKMYDKVIIAKGINPTKTYDDEQFTISYNGLKKLLPTREVTFYSGLLSDFIKKQEGNITLVRGIRNGYDLDMENNFMSYVKDLFPDINVMYIPCDKEFEHISSTAIRSLEGYGEEFGDKYLPKRPDYLMSKCRKKS